MPDHPPKPLALAPPVSGQLTPYDRAHLTTYLQLLDADASNVDWKDTAQRVLALDPVADFAAAKQSYDAHLARARWMSRCGYRLLLGK